MDIYLAARYSRRDELLGYKAQLEALGHRVTSRWLNGSHQWSDAAQRVEAAQDGVPLEAARFATEDMEDIQAADLVVVFSEPPRSVNGSRGGRHVELGLALAWCKSIVVIGPRENVFMALPHVKVFSNWTHFLTMFTSLTIGT